MSDGNPPAVIDPARVGGRRGIAYPPPHNAGFEGREKKALGDAAGLTQFGVNLVTLDPGAMSSLRHWHEREDEFVYVLEGEITLVTEAGETVLAPGMAAGFKAGVADGHHLVNRTGQPARYLEVGSRYDADAVDYPDIDMKGIKENGRYRFVRKSGEAIDPGGE